MNSSVVDFYTNEYDEDSRLSDKCDNRHIVEREVKRLIYDNILKPNSNILEIGAGTGVHSLYLASKGHDVTATDIVPKHFNKIKENASKLDLNINVRMEDALALKINENSYDAVLLAGPIYHINNKSDKEKAIREASRVCKEGGVVFIDYLPIVHGLVQMCLRYPEYLEGCTEEDIDKLNCKDDIFSYDMAEDIEEMAHNCGIKHTKVYGTDGITRFIRNDINSFKGNKLAKWIDIVFRLSQDRSIVGLSEHAMLVGYK